MAGTQEALQIAHELLAKWCVEVLQHGVTELGPDGEVKKHRPASAAEVGNIRAFLADNGIFVAGRTEGLTLLMEEALKLRGPKVAPLLQDMSEVHLVD